MYYTLKITKVEFISARSNLETYYYAAGIPSDLFESYERVQ